MKVTILLCDACQVADGKLYILGGGWSQTGPGPSTMGIAIKIEVPWTAANQRHRLVLRLVTEDGQQVSVPGQFGEEPVQIEGDFEVGRPPGLRPGTPIDNPLAFNILQVALPPNARYEWRVAIDGNEEEEWRVGFNTRPAPAEAATPPGETEG